MLHSNKQKPTKNPKKVTARKAKAADRRKKQKKLKAELLEAKAKVKGNKAGGRQRDRSCQGGTTIGVGSLTVEVSPSRPPRRLLRRQPMRPPWHHSGIHPIWKERSFPHGIADMSTASTDGKMLVNALYRGAVVYGLSGAPPNSTSIPATSR